MLLKPLTICMLIFLTACSHYKDDNIIEEIVEAMLEDKTGIDIDLTPNSQED
jgi:hypothetical protein